MKQEDRLLTQDELCDINCSIRFVDCDFKDGDCGLMEFSKMIKKAQDTKSIKLQDKEWNKLLDEIIKEAEELLTERGYRIGIYDGTDISAKLEVCKYIKSKMGVEDENR